VIAPIWFCSFWEAPVAAAAEEALFIGESTEASTACKKRPRLKLFFFGSCAHVCEQGTGGE
jgi:hypothetical protein